jgi:uncharacterized damage-inducible protein DinB
VALYAHVLGAEHTWLCRLRGEPARVAVWPELGLDACAALAAENAGALDGFVAALAPGGEERPVAYRNSAGAEFRSTVRDILLQVALHGSYHRGQVALLLRDAGAEPRATDYIAFTRGAEAPPRPS